MNLVHRYSEIEYYAETIRNNALPPHLRSDPYLNEQTVRDLRHQAQRKHPDAETIELDATNADHYAFDEAVSPSLLSERSIVIVSNLQNADDKLGETMVAYCKQAVNNPAEASIVICQHEGGIKGKRLIDQLTKAGAVKETVADLKKAEAKLNFTIQCFERRNRRIEPMAAQQLVAVLGDKTGELAAWQDNSASTSTTIP